MNHIKEQKGQTIVAIFVLMIIALSIGLAVSNRFVSNLRNVVQTDQSSRALAVAESAIENILLLPINDLEDYALNGNCTTDCHYEITSAEGEVLVADVTLSKLGNSTEPYLLELSRENVTEINLVGYPENENIYICWNSSSMSIAGSYIHGVVGDYGTDAFAYNHPATSHADNDFDLGVPMFGYSSCMVLNTKDDSSVIRLKSYYADANAVVMPATGQLLPTQGILIESTGTSGNVKKTVSVIITDPVLPAQFDYTLYQKSATEPLSN